MIEETLREYQREGKRLHQRLFLENYPVHNTTTAEEFIKLNQRYEFIARMFSDMGIYGWTKEGFEIRITD